MLPYNQTPEELGKNLQTNITTGLTQDQAQKKLETYGHNELSSYKNSSTIFIFLSQFADPLTYMLFGAAALIFIVGQALDACIISGILIFNAVVGTLQEKKTEKILNNLQAFFRCESLVIRNGQQQIIPNHLIVPGDLISLSPGEKVPADARLITATNLTVDESSLTGESTTTSKSVELLTDQNSAVSQQHNILFAGTYIITGNATAIVYATGNQTQTGKLYGAVETVDTDTPLKRDLANLSHWMLIFIGIMCSSLFIIGLMTHKPIVDLLVMITALFICVIPEGLPIVLTIICVSGAHRMAQRDVLVKRLKAIESLGRIDVIITDKTGTLTRNEMMVSKVFVNHQSLSVSGSGYFIKGSIKNQAQHQEYLYEIAQACALLNDTQIDFDATTDTFKIKGNPTQAAAFVFAQKISTNITEQIKKYTVINTIPFDTSYKYAAIFCQEKNEHTAFILGASEVVLAACTNNSPDIQAQLEKYLSTGYRVVAVAKKIYKQDTQENQSDYHNLIAQDLEFLGLLAISDEARENLDTVIKRVTQARIQIIMATGDHPQTAVHVAQTVGILDEEHESNVITSQEFAALTDAQVFKLFNHKNYVCARFLPEDKLRLVNIFHHHGKIVATTGDGINDVPALVASDVSIAMGSTGSQMTKETADIILTRDSFENIIYAIQQGQAIFHALRRAILYFLTSNTSEVFIIFFALAASVPLPLLPSQILLLNLMTDGFLDASLAMEPTHTKQLTIARKKTAHIFDTSIMYKILFLALPASVISLAIFLSYYTTNLPLARTITFITLTMFQWFNALNCRSETKSVFKLGLFSNYWLVIASITIFILQFLVVYNSTMQYIFKTVPLAPCHWVYAISLASSIFIMEELRKFFAHR